MLGEFGDARICSLPRGPGKTSATAKPGEITANPPGKALIEAFLHTVG